LSTSAPIFKADEGATPAADISDDFEEADGVVETNSDDSSQCPYVTGLDGSNHDPSDLVTLVPADTIGTQGAMVRRVVVVCCARVLQFDGMARMSSCRQLKHEQTLPVDFGE